MENNDFKSMMTDFVKSAQKMQDALKGSNLGGTVDHSKTVTGKSGAGDLTVTAEVNLKLHVKSINFSPSLFDEKQDVVEELVTAAVNDAIIKAQQSLQQEMINMTKGMGLPQEG
jgi:DNA-binding YbaB/EbfC family protein